MSILETKNIHKISVRDLIEICLPRGDLGGGYVSRTRALDGIREHTRIQGQRPPSYEKEVPVSARVNSGRCELEIFGRVDGIFESEDPIRIEEIKTCRCPAGQLAADPSPLHMAQVKCYGHMIAEERGLDAVCLQLTYIRVGTRDAAENRASYTAEELKVFFDGLTAVYLQMLSDRMDWERVRNESIRETAFPYKDFRKSQRLLAESVYKVIKHEKILFARAPTGTGKTIATLFPAIKSLGLGQVDKLFYLTAKTVGRTVALKAVEDLKTAGLKLKTVVLTAKQKICFMSDESCDMEACPYALGYYAKLSDAMGDIRLYHTFDRDRVELLAKKYALCPFELSLDISLFCDLIICDLNYCFDPRVYLKRYFDSGGQKISFLIDEAHNLHDRLRSMYSASLLKSEVLKTQQLIREAIPGLSKSLVAVNKQMAKIRQECHGNRMGYFQSEQIPEDLFSELRTFAGKADLWLDSHREETDIRSGLLDFYFQVNAFLIISGYFDSNYTFYGEPVGENDCAVRLFCLDPSPIFSDLICRGRSAILFSATLFPIDFHREMLFNDSIQPYSIVLPSPFPKENFRLFLHPGIETRYRTRHLYYRRIAELICGVLSARKGNYLICFPSYAFLNTVADLVKESDLYSTIQAQYPNMTEPDRQAFLDEFTPDSQIAGFVVMGGIFGEGIDLTGNRLIGAVIIGPGVPQVCPERDLIKRYYDHEDQNGFFNSYQMPGFNRVMQAAGRVIRTDTDTGVVVLVDERFNRPDYRNLFPLEWEDFCVVDDTPDLTSRLDDFWQEKGLI